VPNSIVSPLLDDPRTDTGVAAEGALDDIIIATSYIV
jgi:hypothetical protein